MIRARGPIGRLQAARALVEGPADLLLLLRMLPWAAALPVLKRIVGIDALARLMWSGRALAADADVAKVVRLSRLLSPPAALSNGACYERSLLAYRYLSKRGADPALVVGVRRGGEVAGHAWVTVGGEAVGESADLERFTPIVTYGRGGRRAPTDVSGTP